MPSSPELRRTAAPDRHDDRGYRLWIVPGGAVDRIAPPAPRPGSSRGEDLGDGRAPVSGEPPRGETRRGVRCDPHRLLLRASDDRVADARAAAGAPTCLRVRLAQPGGDLRAAHAVELGFVFDGLTAPTRWRSPAPARPSRSPPPCTSVGRIRHRPATPAGRRGTLQRPRWVFDGADTSNPVVPAPRVDELQALAR